MNRAVIEEQVIKNITSCEHLPKVVIMCGLAGSGKTTFAKKLENHSYHRLSIDEEIWKEYGRFGIDYPKDRYEILQVQTNEKLFGQFLKLLREKKNLVVDFSFWQKAERNKFKEIVDSYGGRWFLVFMNPPLSVIKRRLKSRNKKNDANAAFPITDKILNQFLQTFQPPDHEGEIQIR